LNATVDFAVSIYQDEKNKTVLARDNLTTAGEYRVVVTLILTKVSQGIRNLMITVYIRNYESDAIS
jgi:stress response protein SCP2